MGEILSKETIEYLQRVIKNYEAKEVLEDSDKKKRIQEILGLQEEKPLSDEELIGKIKDEELIGKIKKDLDGIKEREFEEFKEKLNKSSAEDHKRKVEEWVTEAETNPVLNDWDMLWLVRKHLDSHYKDLNLEIREKLLGILNYHDNNQSMGSNLKNEQYHNYEGWRDYGIGCDLVLHDIYEGVIKFDEYEEEFYYKTGQAPAGYWVAEEIYDAQLRAYASTKERAIERLKKHCKYFLDKQYERINGGKASQWESKLMMIKHFISATDTIIWDSFKKPSSSLYVIEKHFRDRILICYRMLHKELPREHESFSNLLNHELKEKNINELLQRLIEYRFLLIKQEMDTRSQEVIGDYEDIEKIYIRRCQKDREADRKKITEIIKKYMDEEITDEEVDIIFRSESFQKFLGEYQVFARSMRTDAKKFKELIDEIGIQKFFDEFKKIKEEIKENGNK